MCSAANDIAQNLDRIRNQIAETAVSCGRPLEDITLLAVSKSFTAEAISQAIACGQFQFGENRVQEAEGKILGFHGDTRLKWHLVGHLQSNKAHRAAELFDMIHSVDGVKLAMKLNQAGLARGDPLSVLIQVDLGGEETKFGLERNQVRNLILAAREFPGIRLNGLMTIPPYTEDPEGARPFFAELCRLAGLLEREQPGCLGQRHLSMGMSHDFQVAIEEGATIVRIGTALFGERHYE